MGLTRRLFVLLAAVLLPLLAVNAWLHTLALRDALQEQLEQRSQDVAATLAQALSQRQGDIAAMGDLAVSEWDLGHFSRLSLLGRDGTSWFDRDQPRGDGAASPSPAWFRAVVALDPEAGRAPVLDQGREIGTLKLNVDAAWAQAALWSACKRTAWQLALLSVAVALLAAVLLRGWQRPLRAAREQVAALEAGRFVEAEESPWPEFGELSRGLNAMVRRLRQVFETQAQQVAQLQRQTQTDPLTGLLQRRHFLSGVAERLESPTTSPSALLLLRLVDLDGVNQRLGFEASDGLLAAAAELLQAYVTRVPGALAGRLNGSDFGLLLPVAGLAAETAQSLIAALGATPHARSGAARFAVGAIDGLSSPDVGAALAAADVALARSEMSGEPVVESTSDAGAGDIRGTRAWSGQLQAALDAGLVRLDESPRFDGVGRLAYLQCALLIGVGAADEAPFSRPGRPARDWLALALRSRLTPRIDRVAVDLVLAASTADGQPRAVSLAQASLSDADFVGAVTQRLRDAPAAARLLWLQWSNASTSVPPERLQQVVAAWRAAGARVGPAAESDDTAAAV